MQGLRGQLRVCGWSIVLVLLCATTAPAQPAVTPPDGAQPAQPVSEEAAVEYFEKHVRPLLAANCYACHSANTNSHGGLRVDDRNGLVAGGGRGGAIVPHKAADSLLIKAVGYQDKLKMPPSKQLAPEEIAILTKWIDDGAAWPKPRLPTSVGKSAEEYERLRKQHWAWQPLNSAAVPTVKGTAWPHDDIDRFILAKLEVKQLPPVSDADRVQLARRITFDLTGLPPTPEEIAAFVADASPTAVETLVDRLLALPAYGERWGRHWLDVARYAESTGSARNLPMPHSWRYRDYVIDAFNSDKPYDKFLREQIAGDLLPATSPYEKAEQLVATGFLALGVKDVNQRFKVRYIMDNVDEQIDAVSRAVLGLTASCARCHDHKFDPIPTADYYALAGIFRSTDLCAGLRNKMGGGGLDYYDPQMLLSLGAQAPQVAGTPKIQAAKKAFEEARSEFLALRDVPAGDEKAPDGRPKRAHAREKMQKLQNEMTKLNDPALQGPVAFGVRDASAVSDTEIRIRGEAEKLGPVVPRGFLGIIQYEGQPTVNPRQSGRLELAAWLTSDKNPLTSRVFVNRVWQHLFGAGLVKTVDNFGTTGDLPSHPELLDYLAAKFVREGWSIKRLVRAIVLSHSYQLSSAATDAHLVADPANRLVWRHSPRRLEAEEIRDAMLAASGKLDLSRPSGSPGKEFKVIELRNNGPEAKKLLDQARSSTYRSVYLPLLRGLVPNSLEVFDFAEQGMVTGSRDATTVAPQALYLLNDPFVVRQSLNLAERLLARTDLDDLGRIQAVYWLTLGRTASSPDLDRAVAFLARYEGDLRQLQAEAEATKQAEIAANTAAAAGPPDASAANAGMTDATAKKPAPPVNPDQPGRTDELAQEEQLQIANPRTAAWVSFCQALFGSAEFRFLR